MACWFRPRAEDDKKSLQESFLTQQLKYAREQTDKKSRDNHVLRRELGKLQEDLDSRSSSVREAREVVNAGTAELRAASLAHEMERSELHSEAAALRAALDDVSKESKARIAAVSSTGGSAEDRSKVPGLKFLLAPLELVSGTSGSSNEKAEAEAFAAQIGALEAALKASQQKIASGREGEAIWATERARLQAALMTEKELHADAVRSIQAHGADGTPHECMTEELKDLSSQLEQKEEDILTIQFDMVSLHNRLGDQAKLTAENADAFQTAAEELADKEEMLEKALQTQEDLMIEMRGLSEKLESKIKSLSEELDKSNSSLQVLQEQSKSALARVEADRDALHSELDRFRAEAASELTDLRQEVEAAAAERISALELELSTTRANAERTKKELQQQIEATLLQARELVEDELLEELKSWGDTFAERITIAAENTGTSADASPKVGPQRLPSFTRTWSQSFWKECSIVLQRCEAACAQATSKRLLTLEEQLAASAEKHQALEDQNVDLQSALDLSKLLEQQTKEQGQQAQAQLKDLRYGGYTDATSNGGYNSPNFKAAEPRMSRLAGKSTEELDHGADADESMTPFRKAPELRPSTERTASGSLEYLGASPDKVPEVLVSVELDLGAGKLATLNIAPWHTKSDFDEVVKAFLEEQRVRPIFAQSLVRYLVEVETHAEVFPVTAEASLSEIHSRYGHE